MILIAKAVAGLALARGGCKDFLRVFHQEKELTAERLPVVAVPTTARYNPIRSDRHFVESLADIVLCVHTGSAGGGTLGPQTLLLYEPEEALVPLWAKDLSPKVRPP